MDDRHHFVELLLGGDEEAIGTVRRWVQAEIWRYRRRLGEETSDLEQEVLLQLIEALEAGRFRHESRLETYVRSYVRFKCIDHLRARSRHNLVEIGEDSLVDDSPSPVEHVMQRQALGIARRVAAELPESCRQLWMMIIDGLSYREMSQTTGLSEGAIRVRVHRCRQRALELRLQLLEKGVRE